MSTYVDISAREIEIVAEATSFLDKLTAPIVAALPGTEKRLAHLLGLMSEQIVDKLAERLRVRIEDGIKVERKKAIGADVDDAPEIPLVIHLSGLTPTMKVDYMTPSWAPAGWLPGWWTEHGVEYAHRKTESTMFAFPATETWRVMASILVGRQIANLKHGDAADGQGASPHAYWSRVLRQVAEQVAAVGRYRFRWITLSWGPDGVTLTHTDRSDGQDELFREWLRKYRFKWSRNLDAWFLPQSVGFIPPRVSIGGMLSNLPEHYKQRVALEATYADSATTNARRVEHMLDRADLAADRAAKHRGAASAAHGVSDKIGERFYGGQPILVGHHSEKRARADQARGHNAMRKAVEETGIAAHYASKAKSIERAAARVGLGTPEDRRNENRAAIRESGALAVGDLIKARYLYDVDGWIVKINKKTITIINANGRQFNVDLRNAVKHDDQTPMPVPTHTFELFDVVDVRGYNHWSGPYTIKRLQYGGLSLLLDAKVSSYESSSVPWSAVRIHQRKGD